MLSTSSRALIASLQEAIDAVLNPLIPAGSRCALLDFPNHENVGDNAIWLGEHAWLRRRGARLVYTCDMRTYSADTLRKALGPDGIILFHGGGNLGDLYPPYQRFRESVIGAFPDHRIIQLPQSIWFQDNEALGRARTVYNRHKNLVLLLRGHASLQRAQSAFQAPTHLCPDMAFELGEMPRPTTPEQPVLKLYRVDRESNLNVRALDRAARDVADWGREPFSLLRSLNGWMTHHLSLHPRKLRPLAGPIALTLHPLASQRVAWGCRLLSRGRVVITDRLHGHILCLLLGIPHVMLDNNYGKIRAFFDTWTHEADLVRWATSPEDALRQAGQLNGSFA